MPDAFVTFNGTIYVNKAVGYTSRGSRQWGDAVLNKNSAIEFDVNDTLSFEVDESSYSITLEDKEYYTDLNRHHSELVDELNTKLQAVNCPVIAKLGGINHDTHVNVIVFEHASKTENHVIDSFSGNAAGLFGGVGYSEDSKL
ncbi:hypothetical protein D3C81_610060 [compost metagenome]